MKKLWIGIVLCVGVGLALAGTTLFDNVHINNSLQVDGTATVADFAILPEQTPPTLGATVNNYNPTGWANFGHWNLAGATNGSVISGMAALSTDRMRLTVNAGTTALRFTDHDSNSLAANQFSLPAGESITIPAGASILWRYESSITKWMPVSVVDGIAQVFQLDNAASYVLWRTVDTIDPSAAHFSAVTSIAAVPLNPGMFDHTINPACWNQGRPNAAAPQICVLGFESGYANGSTGGDPGLLQTEYYTDWIGRDGKEHRWLGITPLWNGSVTNAPAFFTGSQLAIGSWDTPTHEYAQFSASPSPTTVPASLQLGGLVGGDFGTRLNIEDNDTGGSIVEVGNTSAPSAYAEITAGGNFFASALVNTPLVGACSTAGDCSFTITSLATSESGTITQRASGAVDITATSGPVRLFGSRQQAVSFFDVLDPFGNHSITVEGASGTIELDHIGGETDVALSCNGIGGSTTCVSNSCNNNGGTFQTTGTGATSCTVSFAGPPANAPSCTAGIQAAIATAQVFVQSETNSLLTITGATIPTSTKIDYVCFFH